MSDTHQKDSVKALVSGFALGVVNDLRPKNKFNLLQNIRVITEGVLESRPRLEDLAILTPVPNAVPHSIKTIIDKASSSRLRIVGAGMKLFSGVSSPIPEKDSGYSGTPFFLVDFRPEQSIEAYSYLTEGSKFKKISAQDRLVDVGIDAPLVATNWKIAKPNRKIIDKIDTGSDSDWNHLTGNASAPTLETRVDTTITAFLPDYGTTPNFVSIVPLALTAELQAGEVLRLNNAEDVIVEEILPAALSTGIATIAAITYESGSPGSCKIVLSISSPEIVLNSVLLLNGTEYVKVEEVTIDDNNIPSIKVTTVGTFAVGNTISGISSFRAYCNASYVATNTVKSSSIKSVITAAGVSSITRTFNVDLLNTGIGGKPLTDDDNFHIDLKVSSLAAITEIQIQLAIDGYDGNYYFFSISPNFFTGAADQSSSLLSVAQQAQQRAQIVQRHFIDDRSSLEIPEPYFDGSGEPILGQTTLGESQWTPFNIRIGNFIRVGSDRAKTKKDITGIRISVNATAAVDIFVDSIWCGGAEILDNSAIGFLPYNYVWRIRDPQTRVSSNWSPPLRKGIKVSRGKVELSFPNANINYDTNYKVDIARVGGTLNTWRILGSIKNDGTSYIDKSSDRIVADNAAAGRFLGQGSETGVFDFYKPFAVLDKPKKGVCNITGTKFVWVSGDKIKTSYPRGVQIVIDGIANRFYSPPSTDSKVELERDMGALTSVVFEIEEPLIVGKVLPVIFGPTGAAENNGLYIFGIGDENAAGTVYWTDGNNPDTQSDLNRLELTSPSEPLIGGVIYDGYGFVWSTKRSFMLVPTKNPDGSVGFVGRENANSRGLFSKYAIDVGADFIYFIPEDIDGIYTVEGNGNPTCITAGAFGNLFYTNGNSPTPIVLVDGTIIYPPDFTLVEELRIFCVRDYTYFRYADTNGSQVVLTYDCKIKDFISYDTFPSNEINAFYREEVDGETSILVGTRDAIKKFGSAGTFETSIESTIIPFALDAGDSRMKKLFDELILSIDQGLNGYTIRNYFDNGKTNEALITKAGSVSHARDFVSIDINGGLGIEASNITPVIKWNLLSGTKFYEEIIYFIPQADTITDRSKDTEFGEGIEDKLWQGVTIQADTFGHNKTIKYLDDQGILRATIVINHTGKQTKDYSFETPFISHTIRRTSDDQNKWTPYNEEYVYDLEPHSATVWEGEFNLSGLVGLIHANRAGIAYRSTDKTILTLTFDDATTQTYELPSSANAWHKEFFYLEPKKWFGAKYRFESAANLRLYKKHCELWARIFNSENPYGPVMPFGGRSNESEIMI